MDWQARLATLCKTNTASAQEQGASKKGQASLTSAHDHSMKHSHNLAESKSKLLEALANICKEISINPIEVYEALSDEDIEDWEDATIDENTLAAFANALIQRQTMAKGKRPAHYTKQANCKSCGPVWLWSSDEVLGCPWCWNRINDKPIPRPHNVHCGDCVHFKRISHPNLGHCAKGEPEAAVGLWDTDRRSCNRFLPSSMATGGDHQ